MNILGIVIALLIVLIGAGIELGIYLHTHGFYRNPLKWSLGSLDFWALGDRVLIEEDEFRSGYECSRCGGKGTIACDNCGGTRERNGKKCAICADTDGYLTCPQCSGKGGLLIAPDTAQRRPTTGKIVSAGHKVLTLKVGQNVMYSNFAGHVVDLARANSTVTLRILHESEILCGMSGHLTLTNLRGKSEIAQFTN